MPLFTTEADERHAARLAERDARIRELEMQTTKVYSRRKLEAERDSYRAKFLGLREEVEMFHDRTKVLGTEASWARASLGNILTRFPVEEPSKEMASKHPDALATLDAKSK